VFLFNLTYRVPSFKVTQRSSEPTRIDPPDLWLHINVPQQPWAYFIPFSR